MRIVNGRTLGDSLGSFTCHQYSGSSTVDYAIVEKSLYDLVKYFKVGKYMPDLSDHCVIELCIKSDLKYLLNQKEDMNFFLRLINIHGKVNIRTSIKQLYIMSLISSMIY